MARVGCWELQKTLDVGCCWTFIKKTLDVSSKIEVLRIFHTNSLEPEATELTAGSMSFRLEHCDSS